MRGQYRNVGAPFVATDGRRIARGEVFVPAPADLARRRYKLHAVGEPAVIVPPAPPLVVAPIPSAPEPEPFAGVDFASDVAFEVARQHGLTADSFPVGGGSGHGGAYTAADVRAMILPTSPFDDPEVTARAD